MSEHEPSPAARAAASLDARADAELARVEAARKSRKQREEEPAAAKPEKPKKPRSAESAGGSCVIVEPGNESGITPGLYWCARIRNDKGELIDLPPLWLSDAFAIVADTCNLTAETWGKLVTFRDRYGNEHRTIVPNRSLMRRTDSAPELLYDAGLTVNTSPEARRKLIEHIANSDPQQRAITIAKTGWHGPAYVLPGGETIGSPPEPLLLQCAPSAARAVAIGGTSKGWRDEIALPSIGNSRLVTALSAAFAAPCLHLASGEGGIIHLRGSSSSGKTTALHVACSIYGHWDHFGGSWKATGNSLEGTALAKNHALLVLDEIEQLDNRDAGNAAYFFGNGIVKARAKQDGSLRDVERFLLLCLSSGEIGLSAMVAASGQQLRAGQEIRFIDLEAEPQGSTTGLFERIPEGLTPREFSDQLKRSAAIHHGHAIREWLTYLSADPIKAGSILREGVEDIAARLVNPTAAGQVQRVARRFALIAGAGELASAIGITGWPEGEAARAAQTCFRDWLRVRGTNRNMEPIAMLKAVRAWIAQHGEARLSKWERGGESHAPSTVNRVGWVRGKSDASYTGTHVLYLFYPERFENEICAGFDHRAVLRTLIEMGVAEQDAQGKNPQVRLPDSTRVRMVVVKSSIFDALDTEGLEP